MQHSGNSGATCSRFSRELDRAEMPGFFCPLKFARHNHDDDDDGIRLL